MAATWKPCGQYFITSLPHSLLWTLTAPVPSVFDPLLLEKVLNKIGVWFWIEWVTENVVGADELKITGSREGFKLVLKQNKKQESN